MKERIKSLLPIAGIPALLIVFFARILFTDKIVRAPDILNEFYWTVKDSYRMGLSEILNISLNASWDPFQNSGSTTEGGWASLQFLLPKTLLFWLVPPPASVAWFMVLSLAFGAVGTYLCCRLIGAGRLAAFAGGLIFALAPENASLINAGHVLKMATISFAPWAFYCYERAAQERRVFWYLLTGLVLAFQFFHGHWQIAYYTCLALGLYGLLRGIGIAIQDKGRGAGRFIAMNLVMLVFFLACVSISLLPLASWSKDTNRGVQSGQNSGKGGLNRDEAMSWSMPPEELATFVVPGMFGLSRQEGGENPTNIKSYYWGRMNFTQTTSYLGLLPWLLLPLPLIYRRDRYTWLAVAAIAGGLMFSIGKYTLFYQFLYDHFPGINRFRVPKMMMFVPVLALSIMTARGIECLRDEKVRATKSFKRYCLALWLLPAALLAVYWVARFGQDYWVNRCIDIIAQPTRYEQGVSLVQQRWQNLLAETALAAGLTAIFAAVINSARLARLAAAVPAILIALYVVDVGRINAKFMFLVDVPQKAAGKSTPVMDFLLRQPGNYRTLPMNGEPMPYAAMNIPVMFTSSPVQQQRWQEFLDTFNFGSRQMDIMNVKYLVYDAAQFQQERAAFGDRLVPVFSAPDTGEIVVENRRVLPKGWLVPSVINLPPEQILALVQSSNFEPALVGLVETPPSLPLESPGQSSPGSAGAVRLDHYSGELVTFTAEVAKNVLLVTGEKYANGWRATVDGKPAQVQRVNYVQRGVYLTPGRHEVRFIFDPLSFRVGKWLTLSSFAIFGVALGLEIRRRRKLRG